MQFHMHGKDCMIAFMSLEGWWCFGRVCFLAVLKVVFKKREECESSLKIYIGPGLEAQGCHLTHVTPK